MWIEIGLFVFCLFTVLILYPILSTGLNPIEYWFEKIKELKK